MSRGVQFLQSSGDLGTLNDAFYNLTGQRWLTQNTQTGRFLAGIFGWDPRPSIAQVVVYLAYLIPVLILVFSNTESATLSWAAWEIDAPLWLVLAITVVAGAIGIRLFGWIWRSMRRRGLRRKAEFRQAHYGSDED